VCAPQQPPATPAAATATTSSSLQQVIATGHMFQVQSISESVPIHYGFTKTLKGILLTLWKD